MRKTINKWVTNVLYLSKTNEYIVLNFLNTSQDMILIKMSGIKIYKEPISNVL